jgi:oxygen-independent coproporphyrinogen-3 oxidase
MPARALALYLHIPFCTAKCGYCDFNSYAGLDHLVPDYTPALVQELALWAPATRDYRVETVFFGGGTPSLSSLDDLARIASAVRAHFQVAPDAEWSLEANPTELTAEHLAGMRALGLNRLSIGVQSLHDDELALLERQHGAERALEAVAAARAAGFDNLNLDLIFGLIEQPLARWQQTLERTLTLAPEHLSCYALTVEPGTALYYRVAKGQLPGPDPDIVADQYEWTRERLARAGYRHYELSNWALPGRECRHNLVYWRAGPYLGMGAGAHSFFAGRRFANVDAPTRYVEAVRASAAERAASGHGTLQQIRGGETPSEATLRADALILGLRLIEGIDPAAFTARFGCTLDAIWGPALARHVANGLLEHTPDRLRLTPRGQLLANEVFVDLLPDEPPSPDSAYAEHAPRAAPPPGPAPSGHGL